MMKRELDPASAGQQSAEICAPNRVFQLWDSGTLSDSLTVSELFPSGIDDPAQNEFRVTSRCSRMRNLYTR